jgi:hypothetical protein
MHVPGLLHQRLGDVRIEAQEGVYSGLVETRYREGVLPRCMKASKPFTDEEPLLWILNIARRPKRRQRPILSNPILSNARFLRTSSI